MQWYTWLILVAILAGLPIVVWRLIRLLPVDILRIRQQFTQQREHLEADFLRAASLTGKPRGLRWKSCDWGSDVQFARDRRNGEIVALASVTIQFEAIPGSDMEGLPAVGNLRNASAVFFHRWGRWLTTGKAVFNLNPREAIAHFDKQYELIEERSQESGVRGQGSGVRDQESEGNGQSADF